MSHILAPFIDNLQSIVEHGGYTILFFITILEGIPIVGPLIPGHTAVILSGFLIKVGVFNWLVVAIVVIIGAMLGDITGYFLGKKYGFVFLEKFGKYFFVKHEHIEKAKEIVAKHTGKAIIFGRFSPITRPLAPFAVGASNVPIKRFWFYDFIGVVIWATGSILLGYLFGASYHVVANVVGKFIAIALVLALIIIWGYSFINRRFHIFAKYELIVLILNLIGLYTFFRTVQDALIDRGSLVNIDVWFNQFFASHITPSFVFFMKIVSDIFSPAFLSIVAVAGIIYLLFKKHWRYATITFFSVSGGLFLGSLVKEIVMRPRPIDALIFETDFSFPSGHVVMATIFFTLLIYIFVRKFKTLFWREIFIVISVLLIALTALSRLYLGVHWFSDVVAGCALGLFWTTLMILLVRYVDMIFKRFTERRE